MRRDPFSIIDLIAQKESEIMAAQQAARQQNYVPRQTSDFPIVAQLPHQDSAEVMLDDDEEFIEVPNLFGGNDKKGDEYIKQVPLPKGENKLRDGSRFGDAGARRQSFSSNSVPYTRIEKKQKKMKKKKKSFDKKSLKMNKTWKQQLNTSPRILMGPGPSDVHPRVLKAMATPLVGHLDPQFLAVMDDIKYMVQRTFRTSNHLSFVVSAPGSAGMETCLVNLLEPGDEAVICINGVFGGRMADIAERCGAKVIKVQAPWGEPINPYDLKKALKKSNPKMGMQKPQQESYNHWKKLAALPTRPELCLSWMP